MNVWVSEFIIKSRLSLIVRVNVVLNRTVVDSDWRFDNLCGSHLQSQSELYHVSWWYYTLVKDLIGQLRRDVIGRLSVTGLFTNMRILKFKSQLTIKLNLLLKWLLGSTFHSVYYLLLFCKKITDDSFPWVNGHLFICVQGGWSICWHQGFTLLVAVNEDLWLRKLWLYKRLKAWRKKA